MCIEFECWKHKQEWWWMCLRCQIRMRHLKCILLFVQNHLTLDVYTFCIACALNILYGLLSHTPDNNITLEKWGAYFFGYGNSEISQRIHICYFSFRWMLFSLINCKVWYVSKVRTIEIGQSLHLISNVRKSNWICYRRQRTNYMVPMCVIINLMLIDIECMQCIVYSIEFYVMYSKILDKICLTCWDANVRGDTHGIRRSVMKFWCCVWNSITCFYDWYSFIFYACCMLNANVKNWIFYSQSLLLAIPSNIMWYSNSGKKILLSLFVEFYNFSHFKKKKKIEVRTKINFIQK